MTGAAATGHQLINDRLDREALAQRSGQQQPASATEWASWYSAGISADLAVRIRIGRDAHRGLPNLPTPTDLDQLQVNNQEASGAGMGCQPTRIGQPLIARASSVTSARRSR